MDTARLLLLIVMVMTPSGCSETAEPQCTDLGQNIYNAREGEALYFVVFDKPEGHLSDEEFTWYKMNPQRERITTDKNKEVHNNGGVLVFLNLTAENSGFYSARNKEPSGRCFNYYVKVNVFKEKNDTALNFGSIENSNQNQMIPCPDPVRNTCDAWKGKVTWEKDFKPLQGHNRPVLRVDRATKKDEGIYTCICTWTYNNKVYTSSGSRELIVKETAEPQCTDLGQNIYNAREGEALYFVVFDKPEGHLSDEEFTWYKMNPQRERITTDKNKEVHNNGGVLVFLHLTAENSGFYSARNKEPSGRCFNYYVKVNVFKEKNDTALNFGSIEDANQNQMIPCPDPVRNTCDTWKGKVTWEKDFKPLQGHNRPVLWVDRATKKDEGIYTCICTWTYNNKVYTSSGSRELIVKDPGIHRKPEIISPADNEMFADEGLGIKLNCTVLCGTNVGSRCNASWHVNGKPLKQVGYNQTTNMSIKDHSTAILTIDKVSAKDFLTEFQCKGVGHYETTSKTITFKRRASIIPFIIGRMSVVFFCVLAAVLVKCFAIDLALFFRRCCPLRSHNKDARVYDAYVVYQTQSIDKATEDTLCQFVTRTLPAVLEEKCGYRLFIHGRDDIPGEDRLELVEDCMKQSRRLMVILTPGSGSGSGSEITDQCPASPQISTGGGFDWQVGLHHVLVQREMTVILIQLGDTGSQGYTHLPPGLQHLIRKSPPLRWPEGSRGASAWNSHFWKRVRYLMPATPAKKCPQSAII